MWLTDGDTTAGRAEGVHPQSPGEEGGAGICIQICPSFGSFQQAAPPLPPMAGNRGGGCVPMSSPHLAKFIPTPRPIPPGRCRQLPRLVSAVRRLFPASPGRGLAPGSWLDLTRGLAQQDQLHFAPPPPLTPPLPPPPSF